MHLSTKQVRFYGLKLCQILLGVSLILGFHGFGQRTIGQPSAAQSPAAQSPAAQSPVAPGTINQDIALKPTTHPFDIKLMQQGLCNPATPGITQTQISETDITTPSLWWVRDEIAARSRFGNQLIDNWIACQGDRTTTNRVDLLVNQPLWTQLDYLERYEFLHRFGMATSGYGYNTRVYNQQGDLLGAYTCNFEGVNVAALPALPALPVLPRPCQLTLDSEKAGFRGRSNPLDAVFPTGNGTPQP